jgi:predicted Zn-dependent protease with MMP-like domain
VTGTNPRPDRPATAGRVSRDRHGRGLRSPLLPSRLPAARSRAEQFDQAVMSAVAEVESRWAEELSDVEFAVDDVPAVDDEDLAPGPDVVLDGGVPLARYVAPGVDQRGRVTKARVVLYRRPLESRAADSGDLEDLVEDVLVEQVSAMLGKDVDE